MEKGFVFLLFFLCIVIQVAVMPQFSMFGIVPNILLALVVAFAVQRNDLRVLLYAFLSGLALDAYSAQAFGVFSLGFILTAAFIIFIGKMIFKTNDFFGQFSLIVSASVVFSFLSIFLAKLMFLLGQGRPLAFWQGLYRVSLAEAGLNILLGFAVFLIFKKLHGLFTRI